MSVLRAKGSELPPLRPELVQGIDECPPVIFDDAVLRHPQAPKLETGHANYGSVGHTPVEHSPPGASTSDSTGGHCRECRPRDSYSTNRADWSVTRVRVGADERNRKTDCDKQYHQDHEPPATNPGEPLTHAATLDAAVRISGPGLPITGGRGPSNVAPALSRGVSL